MKKTLLNVEGDSASRLCDTVEYVGTHWLVPAWIESQAKGYRIPERIICLDPLTYQEADASLGFDYKLKHPLPRAIFEGRATDSQKFLVIEQPLIMFDPLGHSLPA